MKGQQASGPSGRDFSWILSGNITYSLCQWLFLIVLAKTGGPEDVGGYALGLAIAAPLLTFANCQGRNLVASDIHDEYAFGEYVGSRALSLIAGMGVVALLAIWTGKSNAAIAVTCLLGLSQALDWMSETYFGLMQKHGRLDRVGQSLILKGPLCLILLTAAMRVTASLVWAAGGLVLARALMLVFFDVRTASRIAGPSRPVLKRGRVLGLLRAALPLGIISAIAAFNFNVPRYFIESSLSIRDLGIFSAVASLVGAGNLITSALGNSSFVAIAQAVARGDRKQYRTLSIRLLLTAGGLGAAGVAVSLVAGPWILIHLFRPEYGSSAGVFTRLMVAGALSYVISGQGYALTAARVLSPQIPVLLCATVTTAIFCWFLVPRDGIRGAADASVLSSAVTLILSTLILARVRPETTRPGIHGLEAVSSEAA